MANDKSKVVDDVFEYIKKKGPILPVNVSKIVGDTLLAGAVLAGLRERNLIKVSHGKIGSSPLYYVDGQEQKLEMLYGYMSTIQKKAFDLIKAKKVLREKDLEPAMRVAMRMVQDFAIPVNVRTKDSTELFYKWYMLSDKETKELIGSILEGASLAMVSGEQKKSERELHETKVAVQESEGKPKSDEIEKLRRELEELKQQIAKKPFEKPVDKKISDFPSASLDDEIKKDSFLASVVTFCKRNKIEIVEWKIVKRNSEIDMTIKLPSAVGTVEYYCKAKNKKKINDGDLSMAFIQGQNMKLPTLLISPGQLTKKAENILLKDLKGMTFRKI